MFDLMPFKPLHLIPMLEQPLNEVNQTYFRNIDLTSLEPFSFSGFISGKAVVCGGIVPFWAGRGYVWTVFDESAKSCFVPVFRGIKRFLDDRKKAYNRIEVAIPCHFEIGIRRAKLLGFVTEVERATKFLPDGTDCTLMVLPGCA